MVKWWECCALEFFLWLQRTKAFLMAPIFICFLKLRFSNCRFLLYQLKAVHCPASITCCTTAATIAVVARSWYTWLIESGFADACCVARICCTRWRVWVAIFRHLLFITLLVLLWQELEFLDTDRVHNVRYTNCHCGQRCRGFIMLTDLISGEAHSQSSLNVPPTCCDKIPGLGDTYTTGWDEPWSKIT